MKTSISGPEGRAPQGNASISDAVQVVQEDPGGALSSVKFLIRFFVALFKPSKPKAL